ncbi:DUF4388 domain-containing protein [Myxococcota bacterium]|nr:DUF4388 domain-containing protein [Myxococcota bacterium]MBU1430784.1 DUF4388 domain-containing protein [Myxococcota bacterium]MBU1898496.1 DUF4388 domain-containing protein [Myxococcota bacterium]
MKDRAVFAQGELIDGDFLVDIIAFLQQSRRTIALTVSDGDVRKMLYFHQGDIIAVTSNQPEDRFGHILYRKGIISYQQLKHALAQINGERKIGRILLDDGVMNRAELWKAVQVQVEEVFYSLLRIERGQFSFASYDLESLPSHAALSTHELLMEGLRRKDEIKHILDQLPNASCVLQRNPKYNEGMLQRSERLIFRRVNGARTVEEMIQNPTLSEFETLSALRALLDKGIIEAHEPASTTDVCSVGDIIAAFNEGFARIHAAILPKLKGEDYRVGMTSFFERRAPHIKPLFEGVTPGPGGRLPPEPLFVNLKVAHSPDKLKTLRDGLFQYLRYLLFIAQEVLPFTEVECLAAEAKDLIRKL